jgi:WD40 repeat protein
MPTFSLILLLRQSLRSNFELKASKDGIVFISSDTETLVCQDRQGIVRIYDLEKSGYVIKCEIITGHTGFARAIKISENRNLLLTPHGNSDIHIYDLQSSSAEPTQKLSFTTEEVGQILCMKDISLPTATEATASYLIAGYESGHLVLFDLNESKALHSVKYDFPVCSVDYDASTNRGVLSSPEIHKIHIFGIDRTKMELMQRESENIELQHSEGKKVAGVSSLKIRTDKKCLFVGSCDGVVNIFSWKSLRKLATLRNHRSEITDIAFSTAPIDNFKSNLTAIASVDGTVSLWDIYYK